MNNCFIKTNDENTAASLRRKGLVEIGKDGNMYVFLNDEKIIFSDEENNKMIFSKIACLGRG